MRQIKKRQRTTTVHNEPWFGNKFSDYDCEIT